MKRSTSFMLAMFTGILWMQTVWSATQDREFKDPQGRYALTLKEGWEAIIHKDGAGNPIADIIYENRERGLLRIREHRRSSNLAPKEFAQREQDMSLRFLPGFTQGTVEPFSHNQYDGAVVNFDFTYGGRPKTARYYYLKIDADSYYALMFEGSPQVLRTMRNRIDLMARSFQLLH